MPAPDQALDDLYALPLEEFTPARNDLAARLRKAGQRDDAEAVKRLAKPSITAWALNQVARREPEAIGALLDAGAALATAQRALMAGRDRAGFRSATEAQRVALERLLRSAAGILQEAGHPANKATLDRLEATLRAAANGHEAGAVLRRGVLVEDLDPSSFGFGTFDQAEPASPIPFPQRPRPAPSGPSVEDRAEDEQHTQRLEHAREAVTTLKQRLQALRDQAAEAERDAAAGRQATAKADQAVAAARETVARAEREAGIARKAQAEAAETLQQLRTNIDQTADDLASAEDDLRKARQP